MFLADFSRRMDREGYGNVGNKIAKMTPYETSLLKINENSYKNYDRGLLGKPYFADQIRNVKGRKLTTPLEKGFNTGKPEQSLKLVSKQLEIVKKHQNNPNKKAIYPLLDLPNAQQVDIPKSSKPTSSAKSKTETKTTTSKSSAKSTKSTRKLLNKYTIGVAGLVGAGGIGYAGYKYATRNKNKNKR